MQGDIHKTFNKLFLTFTFETFLKDLLGFHALCTESIVYMVRITGLLKCRYISPTVFNIRPVKSLLSWSQFYAFCRVYSQHTPI